MPLEKHWARTQTPLRETSARERNVLKGVSIALVATIAVCAVLFVAIAPGRGSGKCVEVVLASTMGAGNMRACGTAAERLCDGAAGRDRATAAKVAEACRKAGVS